MSDNAEIRVTTPGAKTAEGNLRKIADAEKRVGREASDAGRKGKKGAEDIVEGHKKATGWTKKLLGSVKALAGAYIGLQGAGRVLSVLREEIERVDQASLKATKSFTALMALSQLEGEREETKKAVWDMAKASGRDVGQVANAYYTLLGGTSGMTTDRRQSLMQQSLLMAKTDPSADLNAIVSLFATIGTQQADMSPVQIGNLVSQTIEQAKSTPSEMASYLPSILTTARAGKVGVGTAAAMFSFTTRAGGGVAESGTAIRAAMMGLLAPSPDVAKQLARYGFPLRGGLMERIEWLRTNGSKLPPELVAALGGRRGLEAIAAISEKPDVFAAEVAGMQGAMGAESSLLQQRLTSMYGEDPAQALLASIEQAGVVQARADSDISSLARQEGEASLKASAREKGMGLAGRTAMGAALWIGKTLGVTTPSEKAARIRAQVVAENMRRWGEVRTYDQEVLWPEGRPQTSDGSAPPTVNVKNGGTDYHFENKENPAGKPRPAKGH